MSKKIKIVGGIDVGNGYLKAVLKGDGGVDKFDLPAGVALVTKAVDLPTPDSKVVEATGGDFYNELDLTFASPGVHSTHRHLFGTRALRATTPRFEEFDVASGLSKAEQSLSMVLVLGLFAGKAVRDYVAANGALPTGQLDVEARVGLALPINEYREHRDAYSDSYTRAPHLVTVLNFETPVMVRITFVTAMVAAEGFAAQFAIRQYGVGLSDAMLTDVRARGALLEGVTGQQIFDATSTVGVDIGEGTVNFPIFTNKQFNSDASRTFQRGYGTVLDNSLTPLRRAKVIFASRKALADYLLAEPSPLKRGQYDKVKAIVAEQAALFSEQVAEEFRKVWAEIGSVTEVVYVFGGGSGAVHDFLYPLLMDIVSAETPVLFLDARYSRHLNREGLYIAASQLADQADQAELTEKATTKGA